MPPLRGAGTVLKLVLERTDLLQADDVRAAGVEEVVKALAHTGAQAIDVPTQDSHGGILTGIGQGSNGKRFR